MASSEPVSLELKKVMPQCDETIAIIRLNRPKAANAFNAEMMLELKRHLESLRQWPHCRAVILTANGKHFSAGADLAWMKAASSLSFEANKQDAAHLTSMFETLANLALPTICVVKGAAYGGAVGLIACCDITIATDDARFCLSEVKLGLIPAVIFPYLARRIQQGQLRRLALTARVFDAEFSAKSGLIDIVAASAQLPDILRDELSHILAAGKGAQAKLKTLHDKLRDKNYQQSPLTHQAIAEARTSDEGQAGLAAFFAKRAAPWARSLTDDWTIDGTNQD